MADVTSGNVDKRYHKVTLSPCLTVCVASVYTLPQDDPHYFTQLFSPFCLPLFLRDKGTIRSIYLSSPLLSSLVTLLRRDYVACIGPSGPLLWVYCLLAPCPTTHITYTQHHTHTQTHTWLAHSRAAAGGRARWQMHTSAGASRANVKLTWLMLPTQSSL